MKRHHVDAVLLGLLGLLTAVNILHSATEGDRVFVFLGALALAVPILVLGAVLVWRNRRSWRAAVPVLLAPALCLFVLYSTVTSYWPLRATYALSREALDALAERVRTGEQVTTPVRAGFFRIRRAELSQTGIVCLWTRPHPAGNKGFVQSRPDYLPFNLWSSTPLDDRWQFITED